MQVFLHCCGTRDANAIDFSAINFSDLLTSIQRQALQFICLPKYIKNVSNKDQDNNKDTNTGKNKNKRRNQGNSDANNNNPRGNPVKLTNPDTDPECLLPANLEYKRAFSKKLKTGIPCPKADNGVKMCHKYHARGFYLSDNCNFSHEKKFG